MEEVDDNEGVDVDEDPVDCNDGFCNVVVVMCLSRFTLVLGAAVPFLVLTNGAVVAPGIEVLTLEIGEVDIRFGLIFRSAEAT
jgi:hypothetical protein